MFRFSTKNKINRWFLQWSLLFILFLSSSACRPVLTNTGVQPIRTVEQWQRWKQEKQPETPIRHLVCAGPGISRMVIYLDGPKRLAAVETPDAAPLTWTAPYRMAWPELKTLPIWSEGHGRDHLERLLSLKNVPELVIRYDGPEMGIAPDEFQIRTGIPAVMVRYGDLSSGRETFYDNLRFLGQVLDRQDRADAIIQFFDREIAELQRRTSDIEQNEQPPVYLGGVSYRGAHGMNSTVRNFPPLQWVHAENVADRLTALPRETRSAQISVPREQITLWDPEMIFIDAATLALTAESAPEELRTVPLYKTLQAVKNKNVYLLLPNFSYNTNFSSQLANAWFMGTVLYPDRFSDIDPKKKADDIFEFLTGSRVFEPINASVSGRIFQHIIFDE